MKLIDKMTLLPDACRRIKSAAEKGIWGGQEVDAYMNSCTWCLLAYPATIIFTREEGYHSSGWWKNPEYERCYHLSISFRSGKEKKALEIVLMQLFGVHKNWLWVEPPYSAEGKASDVWHYRLFCNVLWQPIKPRGEVYDTELTERGWKSFSELHKK